MAFPYIAESGFETGDFSEWGSTVDTQSKFAAEHFAVIFGKAVTEVPYRGAYAAHLDLSKGTADAYVQSTTPWATALAGTIWTRFYLFLDTNLVMAASDFFTILALQSAGPIDEAVIGVINHAGVIQLVAAETSVLAAAQGAATRSATVSLGQWHCVELGVVVDSGAADGSVQFFLDGYKIGATIGSLTQAALTQVRLGAIGIDAGTTAGHLLFDEVVADESRIYGHPERYPQTVVLTKSGFYVVGPCRLLQYSLIPDGPVDNFMTVYDAAHLNQTLAEQDMLGPRIAQNSPYETKTYPFDRHSGYATNGLYVKLTGTNPRGQLVLGHGQVSASLVQGIAAQWKLPQPF